MREMLIGSFFGALVWCLAAIFMPTIKHESSCKPVAHHERQLSPHEQQPEPIPAVMQGWFDVERWIL